MTIVAHPMSMPESALSVPAPESVYQLVKRAEINPAEVEDAAVTSVEVTVLWERAVLHVAHLDATTGFTLSAQAPTTRSTTRALAPGLSLGATLMLTGAAMGAHGNLAVAGVGALASAASLGAAVVTHQRNERASNDPSRFVVDAGVVGRGEVCVVSRDGGGTRFVFLPGAAGEVELDGVRRDLATLIADGIARASSELPGAYEINVVAGGRYRMEVGALVIQARVVAAGRRFAGVGRRDGTLRAAWGASAIAAAALLGLMRLATQEDGALVAEDHDARLAELRDFVARERDRVEAPVEAAEAAEVNGTAGAAHQGAAGAMGSRQTTATNRRYEIPRNRPNPQVARERSAREQVASTGIFAAMGNVAATQGSQSAIISPWGAMTESGNGERVANGNINGTDVGDAMGVGGLDTMGSGIGGGGHDVGIGTGPLGTLGHGSCAPGEHCTYGRNHGDIRNRERPSAGIRVTPRVPDIEGTIAPETIRRVVLRNMGQVTRCYEQGLAINPNASGRVAVRFVIAGGGAVLATGVAQDDLGIPSVSQCIASAVRRWTFPVPESSGPVTVTYPFSLMPAE